MAAYISSSVIYNFGSWFDHCLNVCPSDGSRASQQSTSSVSGWPLLQESVAAASAPAVVCRGEGVLPVPERVEKKLLNLEFVEMKELMRESWLVEEEETCRFTLSLPKRRSGPVTDILQWLQCFGTMVGVLSQKFPMMVPDLMAYQSTIIKCSRDSMGWRGLSMTEHIVDRLPRLRICVGPV